jgi:hypothetical protein
MQMRILLVSLLVATLIAGVLLRRGMNAVPGAQDNVQPPPRRGATIGGFSEKLFKFAAAPKAEGAGEGAAFQEASARLTFTDPDDKTKSSWVCDVVVRMPLRTEQWGEIPPDYAAYASASAATDAATAAMTKLANGPTEDFCKQWREDMQTLFDGVKGLNAKVSGSS